MEDYDPEQRRLKKGDVFAAWLLCALFIAAIFIVQSLDGYDGVNQQIATLTARHARRAKRTNNHESTNVWFGAG